MCEQKRIRDCARVSGRWREREGEKLRYRKNGGDYCIEKYQIKKNNEIAKKPMKN